MTVDLAQRGGALQARWERTMALMRIDDLMGEVPPQYLEAVFDTLMDAYGHYGRHYHGTGHLAYCFHVLDTVFTAVHDCAVDLALWFHDFIYMPARVDNEELSADMAASSLAGMGSPPEVAAEVRILIMATTHAAPAASRRQAVVMDADLAVLAADDAMYDWYEAGVRMEFPHVPEARWRICRSSFLEKLLGRPSLFSTPEMALMEAAARRNLERTVRLLRR